MDIPVYYARLPHDPAGSRSKNRFRAELLWGVCKMLDLMEEDKDFTVVFDYVCDIEVHFKDEMEFYQIKTHNGNTSAYTCKSITTKKSKNAEGSILGKLYLLNKDGEQGIKLGLVSNVPYSSKGNKVADECICFESLPEEERELLQSALSDELGIEHVDLSQVFYFHTDINLRNPEQEVQGKIVISFEKIKKCEPTNPRALYHLIYDTVNDRACYEFPVADYEALIQNKGITREEFNRILDCHYINEKTGIRQTQQYIEEMENVSAKRLYKKSLAKLLQIIPTSRPMLALEKEIGSFLMNQPELISMDTTIDLLTERFHSAFPVEYSNADKTVFYIIIIYKFEEGVYDNEADL